MTKLPRYIIRLFAFGLLAQGAASAAPPAPVPVVACGQTVPVATTGFLTADLDCTGADGIKLAVRAKLDLAGHTLSGDAFAGVECAGICTVVGPGAIQGFTRGIGSENGNVKVEGVDFANQTEGIVGRRAVQVKGATFTGHAVDAISSVKAVKIENSSFVDNKTAVGSSSTVKLVASSITGGTTGIFARGANLIDSTIDTTTDGGNGPDLKTSGRPRLKNSSCAGTSAKTFGGTWGVCALD